VHVHPVLRGITEVSQPQLPRPGPDGQPNESSQLGDDEEVLFADASGVVREHGDHGCAAVFVAVLVVDQLLPFDADCPASAPMRQILRIE
jgi:hypothetical protein